MKYDLEKQYKEKYKNDLSAPKLLKVVVNTGTGSVQDKEKKDLIIKHLALITGQKPSARPSKKSIATFKTRKGSIIGYSVTLRGKRMYDFLNKLIFVTIPRKRDFRGLDFKSIDEAGNFTVGLKDHLVFPEMVGEDLKSAFGLSVTIVTNVKNKSEAVELFKSLGFPFKNHG